MKWLYSLFAKVLGRNVASTPIAVINDQMNELRPLPMGVKEFHEWSDRIIAGAMVPADASSLKFALAEMIMHLKPTQDFCDDAYFIHCLRKGAVNQVAYAVMMQLRTEKGKLDRPAESEGVPNILSADVPQEEHAVQ